MIPQLVRSECPVDETVERFDLGARRDLPIPDLAEGGKNLWFEIPPPAMLTPRREVGPGPSKVARGCFPLTSLYGDSTEDQQSGTRPSLHRSLVDLLEAAPRDEVGSIDLALGVQNVATQDYEAGCRPAGSSDGACLHSVSLRRLEVKHQGFGGSQYPESKHGEPCLVAEFTEQWDCLRE